MEKLLTAFIERILKPIISQSNYGNALKQRTTRVAKFVDLIKDEVQLGAAEGIEELKERLVYRQYCSLGILNYMSILTQYDILEIVQLGYKKPWGIDDPTVLSHTAALLKDNQRLRGIQERNRFSRYMVSTLTCHSSPWYIHF